MALPDDSKIFFCLCDDSRTETDGKVSLMGFLGDRVEVALGANPAPNVQLGLSKLVLFLSITAGDGTFRLRAKLTNPRGEQLELTPEPVDVLKKATGWANIAFELSPFIVVLGTYTLEFSLDDGTYRRSFEMAGK